MTQLITTQRAAVGVCFALLGFVGLWSDVADSIVGKPSPPRVVVRNVDINEEAALMSDPESQVIVNAALRRTQQGGDYTSEFLTTANSTMIQATATMNDVAQASSNRLGLRIEIFENNQWVVIGSGARDEPSPGENLSVAVLSDTRLKNKRGRIWFENLVSMTYGINVGIYDVPPEM